MTTGGASVSPERVDATSIYSDLDDEPTIYSGSGTQTPAKAHIPLPKLQLLIIFLVQISEPITGTVIYPFVNKFVRDTGVTGGDERKTGYYAGMIESAFFLSEALTVFQWGWLSDYMGRKFVLLIGPLGLGLAMFGFGISKTFPPLVLFRCLQGTFNGNIGVSKSVMAEITDDTNMGEVFSMMPLMWSLGITMGPIIGGLFTSPAERWPETFGKSSFLNEYPYFLPCAIAGLLSFVSFSIGTIGLRETLPSAPGRQRVIRFLKRCLKGDQVKDNLYSSPDLFGETPVPNYGAIEASVAANSLKDDSDSTSSLKALMIRPLLLTYMNYFFIAFMDMAHAALLPLMYSTSIQLGGLGLDPYSIGVLMGTFGTINAILQLKFVGRLIRSHGPRTVYIFSYTSFLVCTGFFPVASYFAKRAGRVDWTVGMIITAQLAAQAPILACYSCIQILIIGNAPNKASLGAVNGIGQMIASSMRSIAPTVATSLFALSLERQLLGGYMVYCIILVVVLVGMRLSWLLPRSVPS